ncbi:ergot alkaloid A [Penicillium lagena]|uniref:ergot alkaloid A n=1 Tax=Penicillium lagena TaxID=94218 RepID=UPI002541BC02|nr:ergot alkaloid A [Penicillium lagena]KAJ5612591.1 ergot alkaloid A [Penicillium lagena]
MIHAAFSSDIGPSLLDNANIQFLLASRTRSNTCLYTQCYFDWDDESTYGNPFHQTLVNGLGQISAAYIVAPPVLDIVPHVIKFIDFARTKTIKRIVFVSASILEKGGEQMGQVHEYLDSLSGELEWTVLRPTWFMENFSEDPRFTETIKTKRIIYTSAGNGKIPFVSVDDIARVAFRSLTDKKAHNTDHVLLGPQSISHDQVAEILTQTMGFKVTHINLPPKDLVRHLVEDLGMDTEWAQMTADMDDSIIKPGLEDRLNHAIKNVTGVPPRTFREFCQTSRNVWI